MKKLDNFGYPNAETALFFQGSNLSAWNKAIPWQRFCSLFSYSEYSRFGFADRGVDQFYPENDSPVKTAFNRIIKMLHIFGKESFTQQS